MEQIGTVPWIDDCAVMQGGCANESFLWVALITTENYQDYRQGEGYIIKYDLATMKEIARSERMPLGHANDITWHPKENALYINETYDNRICMMDADTLQPRDVILAASYSHAIAYEPESDRFVFAFESGVADQKMNFWVSDENMQKIYGKIGQTSQLVSQGMFADEDYLYFLFSATDYQPSSSLLYVTDWDGNPITQIKLVFDYDGPLEPENISIVGNYFYICCNSNGDSAPVFRGTLVSTS